MKINRSSTNINTVKILKNVYLGYFVPWMALTSKFSVGSHIYDRDWDLAIILDACRADALRDVSGEYDFLDTSDIQTKMSVGSSSKEWLVNTFQEDYLDEVSETTYLTGNGWAEIVFSDDPEFGSWTVTKGTIAQSSRLLERIAYRPTVLESDFHDVVYQPLSNVNGADAMCPKEMTDLAIQAGREEDCDRIIAHYMQPHEPYVARDDEFRTLAPLRSGGDRDEAYARYVDNLRYVLDHVETLVHNFDGDVLITADHGEMFGPNPLIGHGEGIPHPKLKWVPWVETEATDHNTVSPNVTISREDRGSVEDRLSALGYVA